MSETYDQVFSLIEVARGQQEAVQTALDGLAAERAALEGERRKLARDIARLEAGTRGAVRSAVTESLAGAAREGVEAVQAATAPLLGNLADVTRTALRAEDALRRVVLWASWRLLGWIVAVAALLVVMTWLASTVTLWFDGDEIAAARMRKAELRVEIAGLQTQIADLQANRDAWVQAGMLAKLERCGPKNRPCIRVDESAGPFGSQGHADYRVILGY